MADQNEKSIPELSLGDDFGPAVLRVNGLTVRASGDGKFHIEAGDVKIDIADGKASVTGGNSSECTAGSVEIRPPTPVTKEIDVPYASSEPVAPDVPRVTTSRLAVKSFSPNNLMANVASVQLNKITPYLGDLPDEAKAGLLSPSKSLAQMDNNSLGTWIESIQRIRAIQGYGGLDGMEIFDSFEAGHDTAYEEELANQIRAIFEQAQSSGQTLTTGFFMPTIDIIRSHEIGSNSNPKNFLPVRFDRNNQQGDVYQSSSHVCLQWSASAGADNPDYVNTFDARNRDVTLDKKHSDRMSAYPVALMFQS